jgi:hypothetical protein
MTIKFEYYFISPPALPELLSVFSCLAKMDFFFLMDFLS